MGLSAIALLYKYGCACMSVHRIEVCILRIELQIKPCECVCMCVYDIVCVCGV